MRNNIFYCRKVEREMEFMQEKQTKDNQRQKHKRLHPIAQLLSPFIIDWIEHRGRKSYKNYFYKVFFSDMLPTKDLDDNEFYDF